jgi:hypothetical protein
VVEAISPDLNSAVVWRFLTSSPRGAFFHDWGSQPAGGALRKSAASTTTAPWMTPQWMKACWYPAELIMFAIGATVRAEPAPNPAAVRPAASPR